MMPRLMLSELLGHEETEKQDRNKQVNKTGLVVKRKIHFKWQEQNGPKKKTKKRSKTE